MERKYEKEFPLQGPGDNNGSSYDGTVPCNVGLTRGTRAVASITVVDGGRHRKKQRLQPEPSPSPLDQSDQDFVSRPSQEVSQVLHCHLNAS